MGGANFSARSSAQNFSDNELREIIDYCHLRGVKVYVCTNILYKNSELDQLYDFMHKTYEAGADAFIMQDLGVMRQAKAFFPDIEYHASTQATVHDLDGVNYMASLGFDRVVMARELSIEQIAHIRQHSPMDLEIFAHGALCYSYSGMCLMSSMIGGRSGNRGSCAQPCRKRYELLHGEQVVKQGYLLSPKDLMGIESVKDLVRIGAGSLKIEGRMKSPEYVAQVTRHYREQIDAVYNGHYQIDEIRKAQTQQVFSRGFTNGYFEAQIGPDMMNTTRPKPLGLKIGEVVEYNKKRETLRFRTHQALSPGDGVEIIINNKNSVGSYINKVCKAGETVELSVEQAVKVGSAVHRSFDKKLDEDLKATFVKDVRKIAIEANVSVKAGEPVQLQLSYDDLQVEVTGAVAELAQNQPLSSDKILEQLAKTGQTPFRVSFGQTAIDENIYISIKELNHTRREATEALAQKIVQHHKRKVTPPAVKLPTPCHESNKRAVSVSLRHTDQLLGVIQATGVSRVYFQANSHLRGNISDIIEMCQSQGIELFVALPLLIDRQLPELISFYEGQAIAGYLVNNYGHLTALKGTSKQIVSDYGFNIYNTPSAELFEHLVSTMTLSPELAIEAYAEVATPNSEVIVYGKIPVMITHQCPVGHYAGEKQAGKHCKLRAQTVGYAIKEPAGETFEVVTHCTAQTCFAQLLHHKPIDIRNKVKFFGKASRVRIMLHDETQDDAYQIVRKS